MNSFADYNLIYGPNGSGKTTISSIFRHLEQSSLPPPDVRVKLTIDGRSIAGNSFPDHSPYSIRVFNHEFVSENVLSVTPEKGMPLILVLGEDSTEKQQTLENLRNQQSKTISKLNEIQDCLNQASETLEDFKSENARIIKDKLLAYDPDTFRNYDKRNYMRVVEQLGRVVNAETQVPEYSEIASLRSRLQDNPKSLIDRVKKVNYLAPSLLRQVRAIFAKSVMSSILSSLQEDHNLATWIRTGMDLQRKHNTKTCLFCEQSIPKERLEELEGHFNDEYDLFVTETQGLITQLEESKKNVNNIHLPRTQDFHGEFGDDFDLAKSSYLHSQQEWNDFFDELIHQLKEKKTQPFRKTRFETEEPESLLNAIEDVNNVIDNHNSACRDFQSRKTSASKRLETILISGTLDQFRSLEATRSNFNAETKKLKTKLANLTADIGILERNLLEYRTPAEELNSELHRYLGHNELRLEPRDTGYHLMRGNGPAIGLSEGEKTALALLYFLKTLEHKESRLEDAIVVLDDPVSSLDSNALYLAFGYIKERTKGAKQLFVLTHNFAFFRQVKNWFAYVGKKSKNSNEHRSTQFYMLEWVAQNYPRQTKLNMLDPLLKDYENEYHYLFAQIYRRVKKCQQLHMEHDYGLANVGRRLLEIFFEFERPGTSRLFYEKVTSSGFDGAKINRILRFTNTYSHSSSTGESGHEESLLLETRPILADILELIKTENENHYYRMIRNIEAPANTA